MNLGVIHDNLTGLDWEVKSLDPNDSRYCQRKMTWQEFTQDYIASLNSSKFGGFDDWRAPSKHELRSLIHYGKINPAFSKTDFETLTPEDYWAGGTYGPRPDCGWVINFDIGATTAKNKTLTCCGVAVRGEKLPSAEARFVDNGDGTITDTYTNLMWEKACHPRTSFSQVQKMLPSFELAGHKDWRLPTMQELSTIFDDSYSNQNWFFDKFFEGNDIPHYITTDFFEDTYVWIINFTFGYDGYYAEKNIGLAYRLVRNVDSAKIFSIPSSGQTDIFDSHGVIVGNDNSRAETDLTECDGYIKDNKTGISYEHSTMDLFDFNEAQQHIKHLNDTFFGGVNDWRLPTVDELRFIVNYGKKVPAVFDEFSKYVQSNFYWTVEKYPTPNGDRNWGVYLGFGCAVPIEKDHLCGCIAVRGGYVDLSDKSSARYEIHEGYIVDKFTRLMWLRNELPSMTYSEYEKFLSENELAGFKGWRIPDMKELSTIVIRDAENNEWFDKNLFPHIYDEPRNFFIASETFNGMFNWGVNMTFAYDGYYANRLIGQYKIKPVRKLD